MQWWHCEQSSGTFSSCRFTYVGGCEQRTLSHAGQSKSACKHIPLVGCEVSRVDGAHRNWRTVRSHTRPANRLHFLHLYAQNLRVGNDHAAEHAILQAELDCTISPRAPRGETHRACKSDVAGSLRETPSLPSSCQNTDRHAWSWNCCNCLAVRKAAGRPPPHVGIQSSQRGHRASSLGLSPGHRDNAGEGVAWQPDAHAR